MSTTTQQPASIFMDHPVITDALKAAPPAAIVASSWFYGVHWDHIVYFLTAVYTLGLIAQQGYKFFKWMRERRREREITRRIKFRSRK